MAWFANLDHTLSEQSFILSAGKEIYAHDV